MSDLGLMPDDEDILTPDEIRNLRVLARDYDRCSWLGKAIMRWTIRLGGLAIGIASFAAAISTWWNNVHRLHGG